MYYVTPIEEYVEVYYYFVKDIINSANNSIDTHLKFWMSFNENI